MNFGGLAVSIENRMGSIREWYDQNAKRSGMTRVSRPYGYIKGTIGSDGDHVDVFVGPYRDAANVFIINTMKAPDFTEYDEQKCLLGFKNRRDAVKFYRQHYDDPRFLGSVITMTLEAFKEKVMQTRENGGKPLTKSRVKTHMMHTKDGGLTVRQEHTNKVVKKHKPATVEQPHEPQSDQHEVKQFIPVAKVRYLKERVEELNKRAKKLGLPPITMTQTGERKKVKQGVEIGRGREAYHKEIDVLCEKIILRGESPRLNGWKVMAAITHMPSGNVVKNVGYDGDMPKKWRTAAPNCDHCKSTRERNDTYIVAKGKEIKQVGKTCLKDFTGHKSPEQMAAYASSIQDLFDEASDPDGFKLGGVQIAYPVHQILALSVDTILKEGFVSRKMVQEGKGEFPTSDGVLHRLFDKDEKVRDITPAASKEAKALVDWLEGDFAKKKTKSDFEHNLHTFVSAGSLDGKAVNKAVAFLAAAYPAYLREKGRLAEKQAAPEAKPSQAVGSIGERYSFDLTLKDIRNISGAYGNTSLYKYEDKSGNRFAYFASKPIHETSDIGKTFQLAATVKDHKEFNGQIETQLTRGTLGGKAPSAEGVKGSRENLESMNNLFVRTEDHAEVGRAQEKLFLAEDYVKQMLDIPENRRGLWSHAIQWQYSGRYGGFDADSKEAVAARLLDDLVSYEYKGIPESEQLLRTLWDSKPRHVFELVDTMAATIKQDTVEDRYGVERIRHTIPGYKQPTRFSNNVRDNRPYVTAVLRLAEAIVAGKKIKKSHGEPIAKGGEAMCKQIGDSLGVNWNEVDLDEFCNGMFVEMEHKDVTGGDPVKTAKIVLAHLKERKDYYTRLERYVEKALPGVYLIRKARK